MKRGSIHKNTNDLNDTQPKLTSSFVRVRRVQRARPCEESTAEEFVGESIDDDSVEHHSKSNQSSSTQEKSGSLSNRNNSSNTTTNRTSLNTSIKVMKSFLLEKKIYFVDDRNIKVMTLMGFRHLINICLVCFKGK